MWRGLLLLWIGSSPLLTAANAPEPTYQRANPAPWVEVTEATFPEKAPLNQIVDGVHRIRTERQCDPASESVYHHRVHRIVSESGIQSGSDLRLTFDPIYEKITLHRLRVQRDGHWDDRLGNTPIQVIQREEDLDYHLLDGRLMLVIHLEDIRIGDAVEWSWTVTGTNPTMQGRFFDSFVGAGNQPIYDLRLRVRVPTGRDIRFKLHQSAPAPTVKKSTGGEDWLWVWRENPPWHPEPSQPAWHNEKPWVDLSEHPDWAATVQWALPLYAFPSPESPAWTTLLNTCRSAGNAEQQILHALRFVQDEIRYLGIEMGAGSHRPNPPDLVLKRRFGDCKDKTVLLITLLRQLGHRAWPALVNTESRQSLETWLPSPYNFDHVVVALEWEGRLLFLDPTRNLQRGPLPQIYITDYARALLVREGESSLVPLHPTESSLPRTEITETFHCPGPDQETTLTIRTVHHGASAEEARGDLAGSSLENLQRNYLEFYAHSHPLIRVAAPLVWKDDPETNTVESVESYTIGELWKSSGPGSHEAEFYPQYIRDLVDKPKQAVRRGPFAIDHPTHVSQETRIHLWDEWTIHSQPLVIDSAGFYYQRTAGVEANGKTVVFRDVFRTKKDHVLPIEVADYLKACNELLDELGHTLEHQTPGQSPSKANSKQKLLACVLFMAVLATAGWGVAARLSRASTIPPPLPSNRRKWGPRKLGFFYAGAILILSLFGLAIHPAWDGNSLPSVALFDFLRQLSLVTAPIPLAILAQRRHPAHFPIAMAWTVAITLITIALLPELLKMGTEASVVPVLQLIILPGYAIISLRLHLEHRRR